MKSINLEKAAELIQKGETVAFPTETVYGLGADAWNPSAIKKVFAVKGRPDDNPLIVHIASTQSLSEFVLEVPPDALKLMNAFWPGPLTLIFKKKSGVLDRITAGLPTVALRWPDHPVSQELISRTGPLVAPSANSSGNPSPTKPEHVKEDFGADFPVLEAGKSFIGLESTVLDVSEEPYRIYRPGSVGKTDIERVLNKKVHILTSRSQESAGKSPGTKYTHYAPRADVRWLKKGEQPNKTDTMYLLHSSKPETPSLPLNVICYDENYQKMAHELYDRFREADHLRLNCVVIEPFQKTASGFPALADALHNRINKAIK